MAVTVADVAVELDRPTPEPDSSEFKRLSAWIARAVRAIGARAELRGVDVYALNPDLVDDVVMYAVVRRASRPVDGAESVTEQASVDDGSVSDTRRFPAAQGDMFILDAWWALLGLAEPRGRVGSMRLGVPSWRIPRQGL